MSLGKIGLLSCSSILAKHIKPTKNLYELGQKSSLKPKRCQIWTQHALKSLWQRLFDHIDSFDFFKIFWSNSELPYRFVTLILHNIIWTLLHQRGISDIF